MTQIIGLSARMGGGKTTSMNFITGHVIHSLGIVRGGFILNPEGKLEVTDIYGDSRHAGIFDIRRDNPAMKSFLAEHLDKHYKVYAFADGLKEFCINVLGLDAKLVYGSQADKAQPSGLFWRNMPGVCVNSGLYDGIAKRIETLVKKEENNDPNFVLRGAEDTEMTVREVLDFVGTHICRKMVDLCWVNACVSKIKKDESDLVVIDDVRYPNEVKAIQELGGKVIRLNRNHAEPTTLTSELALDKDNFDWDTFDYIIENDGMSLADLSSSIYGVLDNMELVS